ncbi:MAG: GHKL domain-containing protein [Lachnospiraceae bacterium]|nr:GHKL domain-containing protein [Lachnospiraceae bacterium]
MAISVENSMTENTVFKDRIFVTAKVLEQRAHGYSIRNVSEAVEKYGGRYAVEHGGDRFLFSILLTNPFPNL